ncbi:MAG: hypothetical protein JWQ42_4549 [Edaphobacter sp.]|nr:hypothetical protein [Edaphobacter sp.]
MVDINFKFRVMARHVLLLCLVGIAASVLGQDAKTMLVMPPAPLLPQHFGAWQMNEPATIGNDAAVLDAANAASLKEFGLDRFAMAKYIQGNGGGVLEVKALQFGDATGAYSAFTYLRRPEMRNLPAARKLGNEMASTSGRDFLVLSGTTVLRASVNSVKPTTVDELKQLASTLPKVGGPKGLSPLLPTYLPAKGLQADSLRYALGPVSYETMGGVLPPGIVGFDKAAEVVTAKYAGQGTLTLLLFPTPQIAADHGRAIEAEMNRQGGAAGTVKLRREGPLVLLTTGAWGAAEAKKMVEGIHLRNELTWNKPMPLQFNTEVRKTASLLTSIAIFCGLGALAAVVLGLFFGGGRAAIRVLQGKPAASEPEFLRIDLSGRTARIHSERPEPEAQR